MIYRPENVLFLGIGLYLTVFFLSPLDVLVPIEVGSFVYIFFTVMTLVLGSRLADYIRLARLYQVPAMQLKRKESQLFWAMLFLGGFGNLLRLVDKYLLRGVGGLSGLEAREVLIESSAGPLSLIGGVLYPFGYLPIFILLGSKVLPLTRWKLSLAVFIFLIPAIDALALFSRSFMLVALAMVYFGTSITLYQGRVFPRKLLLYGVGCLAFVLAMSILIFNMRLDEMSLDISYSVFSSGYAYTVAPNTSVQTILDEGGYWLGLLPIAQYYLHSIPEFQILWSMNETQSFSWGGLLFAPYVKFLAIFGIAAEPDLFELFPRVGVFTSFWGPLWVDFGWLGPIMTFFFGMFARVLARSARAGHVGSYPLYTYFCIVLFFMPVANFGISAQGMYVINAFVVFWFMTRKISRAVPI